MNKTQKNLCANFAFLRGVFLLLFLSFGVFAQEFIPLWEKGKMPNSKGLDLKDDIRNERVYKSELVSRQRDIVAIFEMLLYLKYLN